jgi:hypothetical protein
VKRKLHRPRSTGSKGTALKKSRQFPTRSPRTLLVRRRHFLTRGIALWLSIVAFIFMATVQPTAYGLDFPMATHIALPDSVDLAVKPGSMVALYGQFQSTATISSNVLAMVSLASQQIELARTTMGAQQVARNIMSTQFHWNDSQFGCLKSLWNHESHWNYKAHNYYSGAHGIAQALPADKMDVVGTDWRTNPVTQIRWGLRYINIRYSNPCRALATFNWRGSY